MSGKLDNPLHSLKIPFKLFASLISNTGSSENIVKENDELHFFKHIAHIFYIFFYN